MRVDLVVKESIARVLESTFNTRKKEITRFFKIIIKLTRYIKNPREIHF
jgi:hypothetical protein